MTISLVKKWFSYVGVNHLTDEDVLGFISITKLDRLPPHLLIVLSTCTPLIEIALRRLMDEQIDWGDMTKDV
jgi:hypothetical protein